MKVDEAIQLLENIAFSPTSISFSAFLDYVKLTLQDLKRELAESNIYLSSELEALFIEKARKIYHLYFYHNRQKVEYPPELRYLIVPHLFARKRRPMIQWKSNIGEKKRERLAAAIMACGRCVTASFYTRGVVPFLDIDIEAKSEEIFEDVLATILEVTKRHAVPVKLTWRRGLHIYLPADEKVFENGLFAVVPSRPRPLSNRAPTFELVCDKAKIKVEVWLEAITVHPLQSWVWFELDELRVDREKKELKTVTLKSCAIPEDHYPSINWFVFGRCYARRDVPELYEQILKEIIDVLKLEAKGEVPKLIKADVPRTSVDRLEVDPFRGHGYTIRRPTGGISAAIPIVLSLDAFEPLLDPYMSFDSFIETLKLLSERGLLPRCIEAFLLGKHLDEVNDRHYMFIVAWYLLQNMRNFTTEELDKVASTVAQVHGLRKRMYYYYYYSNIIVTDKGILSPRPTIVPQLREALDSLVATSLCKSCRYYVYCNMKSVEAASRRLNFVLNALAIEMAFDSDLATRLNLSILEKILVFKKVRPLRRLLPPTVYTAVEREASCS